MKEAPSNKKCSTHSLMKHLAYSLLGKFSIFSNDGQSSTSEVPRLYKVVFSELVCESVVDELIPLSWFSVRLSSLWLTLTTGPMIKKEWKMWVINFAAQWLGIQLQLSFFKMHIWQPTFLSRPRSKASKILSSFYLGFFFFVNQLLNVRLSWRTESFGR